MLPERLFLPGPAWDAGCSRVDRVPTPTWLTSRVGPNGQHLRQEQRRKEAVWCVGRLWAAPLHPDSSHGIGGWAEEAETGSEVCPDLSGSYCLF
jgi:hypothetical protein